MSNNKTDDRLPTGTWLKYKPSMYNTEPMYALITGCIDDFAGYSVGIKKYTAIVYNEEDESVDHTIIYHSTDSEFSEVVTDEGEMAMLALKYL